MAIVRIDSAIAPFHLTQPIQEGLHRFGQKCIEQLFDLFRIAARSGPVNGDHFDRTFELSDLQIVVHYVHLASRC